MDEEDLIPSSGNVSERSRIVLGVAGVVFVALGIIYTLIYTSKKDSASVEIIPVETSAPREIYIHVAGAVEKPGIYKLPAEARINDALISAGGLSAAADRNWFNQNINLAQKLTDGAKIYILKTGEEKNQTTNSQGKINLNTATLSELDSLPGIGPAFAQKIIDYRTANGPFQSVEDLTKVPGIGQKMLENIKNTIAIY